MQKSLTGLGWFPRLAAVLCVAFASGFANASVISPTPTLPPANGVYVGATGAGCFPLVGICVGRGTLAITSVVSSTFDQSGQELALGVAYTDTLTNTAGTPLGTATLTGEMDEGITGRTGPTETGTWASELDSLSLSGTILGDPISVGLDPMHPTTGEASIAPAGSDFLITSFFDVFAEITVTTPSGTLTTTRGPLPADLVAIPEPATILLLGLPFAALLLARRASRPASRRGAANSR